MELAIGIRNTFKMILITPFVLKVSWISMEKMSGETVMMMNLAIVKVSPVKRIM